MMLYPPHAPLVLIAFVAMMMISGAPATWAQTTAAPTAQTPPDPARQEAKPDRPGLFNDIGKLFVNPADLFPSLKLPDATGPAASPSQPGDLAVETPPVSASPASPTTATAPAKLPATALVPQAIRGRASCPLAANGAPDCKAGADRLCQDNGFAAGRSLDVDSAQTCSTKALLAGARTIKDVCKTENFVTRAMCQ